MTATTVALEKLKSNQVIGWSSDVGAVAAADVFVGRFSIGGLAFSGNSGLTNPVVSILDSISGDDIDSNFLNVTGTLPADFTTFTYGALVYITPQGTHGQSGAVLNAFGAYLLPGYSGTGPTVAGYFENQTPGTGTRFDFGTCNMAISVNCITANTNGHNCAIQGAAAGGLLNCFLMASQQFSSRDNSTNLGVVSLCYNSGVNGIQLSGYFGLYNPGDPVPTWESAALIADRGSTSSPIALFRVNNVTASRVNKDGYYMTRKTAAPADADLANSELAFWLDATPAATKAMFKAKDSAGTVRTGSVNLT